MSITVPKKVSSLQLEMEVKKSLNKSQKKELVVKYQNGRYDLTKFIQKHPGGRKILENANNKSIDQSFIESGHSDAAQYLLNEYKIKENGGHVEDLEDLVDWNKPMLGQIQQLGEKYFQWVNSPVDRPLRLFENDFLELLTKTPWYIPMLFWIPVILIFSTDGIGSFKSAYSMFFTIFRSFCLGLFIWTFLEYILHRYIFHIDLKKNPKYNLFHFLFHGLHHKVPFDEYRLVFPPIAAAVIASILYQPIRLLAYFHLIQYPKYLLAGSLTGYLSYDIIHYYIHHGRPAKGYFYNLKRYHNNHHFINHDKGFGVSNTLWDYVFNTKISLRKLKYFLKW